MNRYTDAMRQALEAKNWYAALYMALTMPDICSKLEKPGNTKSGERYKGWFDSYLAHNYNRIQDAAPMLIATDCWALRCSILHEGSEDISGQPSASQQLSRICFTSTPVHRIRVNDLLMLNVRSFCNEMIDAVERWSADVAANTDIQQRIAAMVSIRNDSFSVRVRLGG